MVALDGDVHRDLVVRTQEPISFTVIRGSGDLCSRRFGCLYPQLLTVTLCFQTRLTHTRLRIAVLKTLSYSS